jgi:hypothetical protein
MQDLDEFSLDWVLVKLRLEKDQELHPRSSEPNCGIEVVSAVNSLDNLVILHSEVTDVPSLLERREQGGGELLKLSGSDLGRRVLRSRPSYFVVKCAHIPNSDATLTSAQQEGADSGQAAPEHRRARRGISGSP